MDIKTLQRLLNRAGANPRLAEDGKIGPMTRAAIRAFQASRSLKATGEPDHSTFAALKVAVAAGIVLDQADPVAPADAAAPESPAPNRTDDVPPWFRWALEELGIAERTKGSNPRIVEYRDIGQTTDDEETDDGSRPWCSDFVCAGLESVGIRSTRSGMARSFERSPHFVRLPGPALGCIVTFWRKSPTSGLGHVGFYAGETATHISVLGGNQGDRVSIAAFRRASPSFGLFGYWWPAGRPLPEIGALAPIRPEDARDVSMT